MGAQNTGAADVWLGCWLAWKGLVTGPERCGACNPSKTGGKMGLMDWGAEAQTRYENLSAMSGALPG